MHASRSSNGKTERLIDAEEMTSELSKFNGVYRLIRMKELQRNILGTTSPAVSKSEEKRTASGSEERRESVIEAGDVLVGDRSRLNPVYRLIRRKELRLRFPAPPTPDNANLSQSQEGTERRYRRIDVNSKFGSARHLSTSSPSAHSPLIGQSELASEEAKMNPVFRLIRKTELKKRFLEKPNSSSSLSHWGLGDFVTGFDPFGSLFPDPLKDSYLSSALDPGGDEEKSSGPPSEPLPVTGNAAVDRTIRIRQLVMRLRKEAKLKSAHQASPSVPQVPWLLPRDSSASDGRSVLSESQNKRLMELRENKKVPKPRAERRSPPFTLFDKALGSTTTKREWKQEVKRNLTSEHFEQLQSLQSDFPALDVGRLLGIKIQEPHTSRNNHPKIADPGYPSSDTTAMVSKVQSLLKLLDELGCPSDKALEFVSKELDALIQGGRTSLNNSHRVGEKLAGLSAVLGGLSMEESVALATLQPSTLNRRPETLESNLSMLEEVLDLKESRIMEMVRHYPPLMELNPNTVKAHLAAIREAVLSGDDSEVGLSQLREAIASCPSWLGMKPESMKAKVELVRTSMNSLYSKASGGDHQIDIDHQVRALILGYPTILALGHPTLEGKFKRLESIVCSRSSWSHEILQIKPKSLGRILGAGSKVISRLEFFIHTGDDPLRPDVGGGTTAGGRQLGLLKLITLPASEFKSCFPRFALFKTV